MMVKRRTDFIEWASCMALLFATLLGIVLKSSLSLISGSVLLVISIKFIYEYRTQKENELIFPVGLYFILLLECILLWAYNRYISLIFGLVGTLSFIGFIYKYKESFKS